jgi:lipopolysaccharide transport system ATP-binding protein
VSSGIAIAVQGVSKCFNRRGAGAPTLKRAIVRGFRRASVDQFWALRNVSLEAGVGETIGIIGANGSGKSTLLRLIGGLGKPTTGRILRQRSVDALMSLGDAFDPLLTGRENAVTAGLLAGYTSRQARAKLDEIVAFSELEEFFDLPLRTYSDGMRLRLGFAVAISTQPEVLLIDEVLAVGDLRFQRKCLDRLRELQQSGSTVLLASHDESQVRTLCDRAVWLERGQVRAQGTPDDVYDAYHGALLAETERRSEELEAAEKTAGRPRRETKPDRWGTFEVEIVDVRVMPTSVTAGEVSALAPIRIEVDVVPRTPVTDPIVAVSFHRSSDASKVLDVNTDADGLWLGRVHRPATVAVELERLDLEPGVYLVAAGVYERAWTFVYDYHWQVAEVEVTDAGVGFGPPRSWHGA